jgi:outer membrane protein TolC
LTAGAGISKFGRYTADGAGNAATDITPGRTVPTHLSDLGLGLQATWEIDAWGRLKSLRESALAQYLGSIEGTHLVVTQLISDLASAYFELVALDHSLDVLQQTVKRQQEALSVVHLQKLAGRANELAVQQFAAQLASTRALEQETARRIAEAENQINLLRGSYPQPVGRSKAATLSEVGATVRAGVPSSLLQNRPDIRQAELQVQAAKFDLKAARAAFFPSLSITAGAGFRAFDPKLWAYRR